MEILGQWINLPDPDSVASLSARYDGVCTTIAETKSQLSAIGSAQDRGPGGRGWRPVSSPPCSAACPVSLSKHGSPTTPWREPCRLFERLRPVVAALRSLAYQAEEAQGTVRATQAAREQAIRTGQASAIVGWDDEAGRSRGGRRRLDLRLSSWSPSCTSYPATARGRSGRPGRRASTGICCPTSRRYAVDAGHLTLQVEKDAYRVGLTLAEDSSSQPITDRVTTSRVTKRPWTGQWDWAYGHVGRSAACWASWP